MGISQQHRIGIGAVASVAIAVTAVLGAAYWSPKQQSPRVVVDQSEDGGFLYADEYHLTVLDNMRRIPHGRDTSIVNLIMFDFAEEHFVDTNELLPLLGLDIDRVQRVYGFMSTDFGEGRHDYGACGWTIRFSPNYCVVAAQRGFDEGIEQVQLNQFVSPWREKLMSDHDVDWSGPVDEYPKYYQRFSAGRGRVEDIE